MQGASAGITELYDGVWTDEIVAGTANSLFANSVSVLREMFPELFNKINPLKPSDGATYISTYDASELLRRSLNRCATLLRDSKAGLLLPEYSKWAEAYYQTSLLLFGEKGLTPYKLKLTLFPSLVKSGFIQSPWFHMCEGLEKSNHHAHKDFQTRTMRGGGTMHSQDPMFLELCFSFCKFLKLAIKPGQDLSTVLEQTSQAIRGMPLSDLPRKSYRDICQTPYCTPTINVGKARPRHSLLSGLRFLVTGSYAGTTAVTAGAERTPSVSPQAMVEEWIRELGGVVIQRGAAESLYYHYSRTPNHFIVLKDGEELYRGTMTDAELLDYRAKQARKVPPKSRRGSKKTSLRPTTADDTASDSSATGSATGAKRKSLSAVAKLCREFAGGQMTFLRMDYIVDSLTSEVVLDPYSDQYKLIPGSNVKKRVVKDIRPLLMHQTTLDDGVDVNSTATGDRISAISALKSYRKTRKTQSSDDTASRPTPHTTTNPHRASNDSFDECDDLDFD